MKRILKNIVQWALIPVVLLSSCSDDFVNTKPLGEVRQDEIWKDAALSEAFVTELYVGLGVGGFDEQMLASLTDEALFTHPGRQINIITESLSDPANPGWTNTTYHWNNMYARIRACNIGLKNLETATFSDEALKKRLTGETHFMRAYFYHQLLRYYGGVPIIEKVYELGETDYTSARNTFEECVNFIVKECDVAAEMLKGTSMPKGRATDAAALALKSRILLYAASDLHDIPTAKTKSTLISGFSKPELLGYVSGNRTERWQKAKDAALAVLNLPAFGYMLNLSAPVTPEQGTQNYQAIAMGGGSNVIAKEGASELIFARYFVDARDERGAWVGRDNGPNGYHNWAGNTPLQNLVDDYEMIDGSRFDWNNPEMASHPYKDRDPRFYATILYDGAKWKPRTTDVKGKDPYDEIQTGQYQIGSAASPTTYFGLDARNSSVEDWNGTRTGYYMKKFVDPNPAIVNQFHRQQIPWPFFRYTEAVLNYAEACIELGQDAEARAWLNKIRFRAGMPAITESGNELRERYRNERRIELAYEEHRFHDARRWMIAPSTIGEKARIIRVEGKLKPGKSVTIYRYSEENYNYTYTAQDVDPGIENRKWNDKMYFLPIYREEVNRNNKLVQNPGY
ncbi:RagB/SusD family nutrient uptake outer membrane protein [Arcticibacter sp. MXS-1]|uniref:RagB/SusD family nutrient uptake outer membrane protein n=1 Tax=Arcticibacter sp. MXS-1 TaxID=3341726 RepID=UPI0035A93729